MFGGGIADKFGNAYEARWAVRQLIDVFSDKVRSIRLEGISADFHGFEFAVDHGSYVAWHQTKINSPSQNWTIRALENEGVLEAFAKRLRSNDRDRCVFVSQSPPVDLLDLSSKAAYASDYFDFSGALTKQTKDKFKQFYTTIKQTPEVAFNWLRRCEFRVLPESEITSAIEVHCALYFDYPSSEVYPVLRGYLEDRLNRLLTTEIVRSDIKNAGILKLKEWQLDPTLRQKIAELNTAYLNSYVPFGAKGHVVQRTYSDMVMALLDKQDGPSVILLSGVAGAGKSGVVRDILDKLTNADVLHLAFRIDQNLTCRSPQDFGRVLLSRDRSPVTVLKGLSPSDRAVLLVDQIDAVSEVSGRNGAAKNAVLSMVEEVRQYASVRIVLVCRSFDIESDERLKKLRQSRDLMQIDVPLFDWADEVYPVVASLGINPDVLDATQMELLRLPLNLAVFAEIATDGDTQFRNRNDLFAKLLQKKARLIAQNRDGISWAMMTPLIALADWMSDHQSLDAPESVLDEFSRAAEILKSEHLVVSTRGRLGFFHESIFDYVFARAFLARPQSLVQLLVSSEQHLFRRTQVRQILESMRQSDFSRYIHELGEVLSSKEVRFHIKIAVAQWLSALGAPTDGERDVVLSLDVPTQPLPLLFRIVIQGAVSWFDSLNRYGWVAEQLTSNIELRRQPILWWLGNISSDRPQPIAQLLNAWWNGDPIRGTELLDWFAFWRHQQMDQALINLCVLVINSRPPGLFQNKGNFRRELLIATRIAGRSSVEAANILKIYFDDWFQRHVDGHPFERDEIENIDLNTLGELGKKSPLALLEGSIDALARAFQRIAVNVASGKYDHSFNQRAYTGHNFGSEQYLRLLKIALERLSGESPEQARLILHRLNPHSHEAAAHLYLETIASNPQSMAGELPPLLASPVIFKAGWIGAEWRSFADAAKAALPYLSDQDRAEVERAVLDYQPELDFAILSAQQYKAGERKAFWVTPTAILGQLKLSGYKQFCILESLGNDWLSSKAVARLAELRRKFRGHEIPTPSHVEAREIKSPISTPNAAHMTDEQWLSAMRSHDGDDERYYADGSIIGGARQLAQVLQRHAKEDPERFCRLLPQIPAETNHAYVEHLLWGLAEAESVPLALLETVVLDAHARMGRQYGNCIALLFERHPELGRPQPCWEILVWYIQNGEASDDADVDTDHSDREMVSIEYLLDRGSTLHVRGINGVRGRALEALSEVLWNVPERRRDAWSMLGGRIDQEKLISVRCCVPRPLVPLFNEDKYRCASLLGRLISLDAERFSFVEMAVTGLQFPPSWMPPAAASVMAAVGRVTAKVVAKHSSPDPIWLAPLITRPATELLPYIIHQVPTIGRRLLSKLLTLGNSDMRLVATWHIIRASYNDICFVALADSLERSSLEARRLASSIAAHAAVEDIYRERATRKLLRYFDDVDLKVREEASGLFRNIPSDQFASFFEVAHAYVASKAFETDAFPLLNALEDAQCDVAALVVVAAERALAILEAGGEEAGKRDMDIHMLGDIIKTEYMTSERNPGLRKRLLDVIDRMLTLDPYSANEMIKSHER